LLLSLTQILKSRNESNQFKNTLLLLEPSPPFRHLPLKE
jgi:hypothetical protein